MSLAPVRAPIRTVVRARLVALWVDLRGAVTLRRREKRFSTYALRLLCLTLLLVVLPVNKLMQLGLVGFVLASFKVALAAAMVVAVLAAVFALEAWRSQRGAEHG